MSYSFSLLMCLSFVNIHSKKVGVNIRWIFWWQFFTSSGQGIHWGGKRCTPRGLESCWGRDFEFLPVAYCQACCILGNIFHFSFLLLTFCMSLVCVQPVIYVISYLILLPIISGYQRYLTVLHNLGYVLRDTCQKCLFSICLEKIRY